MEGKAAMPSDFHLPELRAKARKKKKATVEKDQKPLRVSIDVLKGFFTKD